MPENKKAKGTKEKLNKIQKAKEAFKTDEEISRELTRKSPARKCFECEEEQ